jgi:hypothetical protein
VLFVLGFFLDFFELVFIIVPLIVPAADALGIDLIWLGVILAMNMQTSFLTPPFGFALFYLRSVAPKSRYKDTVTGKLEDPVRTDQIYAGSIPYIFIQLLMVVVVILFPQLVLHYKAPTIDPSTVTIEMPTLQPLGGGLGGGLGQPGGLGGGLGAPAGLQPGGNLAPGGLGTPPALQPQGGLGQPPALQPGGLGQPPAALQPPASGD